MSIIVQYGAKLIRVGMQTLRPGQGPLAEVEIVEFEAVIGTNLPELYRLFLLEIGGVCFDAAHVPPVGKTYSDFIDLSELYGGRSDGGLWFARECLLRQIPDNMIGIGDDAMNFRFCLAIKGPERGRVFLWDRDDGKICLTAKSFEDFIDRIERDPKYDS